MIRFIIQDGEQILETEWQEELVKHGPNTTPTAVTEMTKLRQRFPFAAIRIERTTVIPQPDRQMFRLEVFLKDAQVLVVDKSGPHGVHVTDTTLLSVPYQEAERERIMNSIREKYPDAKLKEVKL